MITIALLTTALVAVGALPTSGGLHVAGQRVPVPATAIEVLRDATGTATIGDVRAAQAPFQRAPSKDNLGYDPTPHWLRVRLPARPDPKGPLYLEVHPTIESVELYEQVAGQALVVRSGRSLPVPRRPVSSKRILLPLHLDAGQPSQVYLRLCTHDTLELSLALLDEEALLQAERQSSTLVGFANGALLALLLYNFFVFLSLRDRTYLTYALFQSAFLLLQAVLDQALHELDAPALAALTPYFEVFLAGLATFFALRFVRSFLDPETLSVHVRRLLRALEYAALVLAASSPLADRPALRAAGVLFVMACALLVGWAAVSSWRKGSATAALFCAGWGLLVAGTLVSGLAAVGVIPAVRWTEEARRVGGVAEAILLSFGLAQRITLLRRQNERVQNELARAREDHAATLETRVAARTSELQTAMVELRSTQARLVHQARLASLGHLVAGVAHEIGNPLNFVLGGVRELSRRLELVRASGAQTAQHFDETWAAARIISRGADRIRVIVTSLRAFLHNATPAVEVVDVAASIDESIRMTEPRLRERGVEVSFTAPPDLPGVALGPGELGQIIVNLLLNAAAAMDSGGHVSIEATVTARKQIELRVADDGPGVPPEIREAIFDPFFTTRTPAEGSGLGLSICHQILERRDGSIALVPSAKGATFVVTLPVVAAVTTS